MAPSPVVTEAVPLRKVTWKDRPCICMGGKGIPPMPPIPPIPIPMPIPGIPMPGTLGRNMPPMPPMPCAPGATPGGKNCWKGKAGAGAGGGGARRCCWVPATLTPETVGSLGAASTKNTRDVVDSTSSSNTCRAEEARGGGE